jgi:hypothetical protein
MRTGWALTRPRRASTSEALPMDLLPVSPAFLVLGCLPLRLLLLQKGTMTGKSTCSKSKQTIVARRTLNYVQFVPLFYLCPWQCDESSIVLCLADFILLSRRWLINYCGFLGVDMHGDWDGCLWVVRLNSGERYYESSCHWQATRTPCRLKLFPP